MEDKDKNIATSTSSFYEEYIDTHPNRLDEDYTVQVSSERSGMYYPENSDLNYSKSSGLNGSFSVPLVFLAVVISLWLIWR